jgi:hypothetical protein
MFIKERMLNVQGGLGYNMGVWDREKEDRL